MKNGGRTAETFENGGRTAENVGNGLNITRTRKLPWNRPKRWKITGRRAKTWRRVRTKSCRGREMGLSLPAGSVYLSFTAESQGSRAGLSFPGIVGGRWLSPRRLVGNGFRSRFWAKRGHLSGKRSDIHKSYKLPRPDDVLTDTFHDLDSYIRSRTQNSWWRLRKTDGRG